VEADQVDFFAAAVFGYFQQVEDAEESRFTRKRGCDVGEADGLDGIDFDFTFFHGVASADFDAGSLPDADAAGDVSATDAIPEAFCKHHCSEFTPLEDWLEMWVIARRGAVDTVRIASAAIVAA
jgi:hypothetical protein